MPTSAYFASMKAKILTSPLPAIEPELGFNAEGEICTFSNMLVSNLTVV